MMTVCKYHAWQLTGMKIAELNYLRRVSVHVEKVALRERMVILRDRHVGVQA